MSKKEKVRHILSLSGGKDSTALAIYMRDKVPEMEYAFCDTGKELKETYEFLQKIEAFLGKPIVFLNSERDFDHWLEIYSGFLPSAKVRWCTKLLKIRPFEEFVGDDTVYSYIGIRADENREGYISKKPNIIPVYPFKEDGIGLQEVRRILDESGIGYPDYYKWRTRSGCYFCFFQRKAEWIGLKKEHPDLFEKAKKYEKIDQQSGRSFTWQQGESLKEMAARENEIIARHDKAMASQMKESNQTLFQVLEEVLDMDDDEEPCLICHL